MPKCASCSSQVPEGSRFCPWCGRSVDQASAVTEERAADGGRARARGRFTPGITLSDRYRIVDMIGTGGMGEVYRADDLKLDQSVALKFLPEGLSQDAVRSGRFRREVRLARQVSHPNVCRVYDIGEVDGHHFLSMEYIDGEDLGSLLRRIGRLPTDKATEIARQLCAGLAAAHARGVLHRDLKPANIMIDGRGQSRITDFGLAAVAGEIKGAEVRSGTPAYMAPEQLAGEQVSMQSDLYALGLVLYELFTGKRAFEASTPQQLAVQQESTTPNPPSSLTEGMDPAIERTILRCLEKDPSKRPPSALAIAAALPGADPLAQALAAGETPSPELVAEAGAVGGLSPALAWTSLGAVVIGTLVVIGLSGRTQLSHIVPLPKSPEILAERSREVVRHLGYTDPPLDTAYGFSYQRDYVSYLVRQDEPGQRWERLATDQPSAILFWYRQSPRYLIPNDRTRPRVSYYDPPSLVSGMVRLRVDPEGRLIQFDAVPPELDESPGPWPEPDWSVLFNEAGLELEGFESTSPTWAFETFADQRAAWEGAYPHAPATPIRVEAASYHGRAVAFRIIEPWTKPSRMEPSGAVAWESSLDIAFVIWPLLALIGAAMVARRNLRLGRGDRRGAFRLGLYLFFLGALSFALGAHLVPDQSVLDIVIGGLLVPFFFSFAVVWLLYIALEPYVRRLWPEMMVSWIRLLDGRWRDPLIGRDVLVGCLLGVIGSFPYRLYQLLPGWGDLLVRAGRMDLVPVELSALLSTSRAASEILFLHRFGVTTMLFLLVSLLLFRFVLRKTWLAAGAAWLIGPLLIAPSTNAPLATALWMGVWFAALLLVLFRFGLLSIVLAQFLHFLLGGFPLTTNLGAWYSGATLLTSLCVVGLAVYGFKVSLAGRPAFRDPLAET